MIKSTQPPSRKCSLISLILAILLHGYILFFVKYSLEEEKKISPKLPIKLVNLEELRPPSPPPKAPPPKLPPKLPSPPKVPPKEFIPVEEEPEEEEVVLLLV